MQGDQATWDEEVRQEVATLQNQLANQITLAAGWAELLSVQPDVPPAVRARVTDIVVAVFAAGHTLQRLLQLTSAGGLAGPSTVARGNPPVVA